MTAQLNPAALAPVSVRFGNVACCDTFVTLFCARAKLLAAAFALLAVGPGGGAQTVGGRLHAETDIHLVWMGGDDCPPCAAWKRQELPRFLASPQGQSIRVTGVPKPIRSGVPAVADLPTEVRPYKAMLDEASSGRAGSPQTALLVNGKLYDYYFGTRSADMLAEMVDSVRTGSPYPVPRCLKLGPRGHHCDKPA